MLDSTIQFIGPIVKLKTRETTKKVNNFCNIDHQAPLLDKENVILGTIENA